ncbi:TPA: cellulose biosynthesis protein BcsF [Enterobacter chengduensis]|nr:cellulose biosynthesis protein BcsF [Enterobacter chengduensis]
MNISDIIQLVILCALIFFPLGYYARHSLHRLRDTARMLFVKPRYVKPAGTLTRAPQVKANRKHD